jgi:hypothetical protein
MEAEKDPATLEKFLDRYIFGTKNFEEYINLIGGVRRMAELHELEPLRRAWMGG